MLKLGILKGHSNFHEDYILACKKLGVKFLVIDFLSHDWLEQIKDSGCDGYLCRPPCDIAEQKVMYDEKLFVLENELKLEIYPSYKELYLYENKRVLSYFLKINNIDSPITNVFSDRKDALDFIKKVNFPIVFKSNIGASSSGVSILKSKLRAKIMIFLTFGFIHPLMTFGYIRFRKERGIIFPSFGAIQKHYIIMQDFHKIKWEWRIIKIGNSYFGHKKLLKGQYASGSDLVGWDNPPEKLLRKVKHIMELEDFRSAAIDIFETLEGEFLVNEIQSNFGSYLPYQMKVNGKPGRYCYSEEKDQFIFEEGLFNEFSSNILRIEDFISRLEEKNYAKMK